MELIFQVLNKVTGGKLHGTRRISGGRRLILKALEGGENLGNVQVTVRLIQFFPSLHYQKVSVETLQ